MNNSKISILLEAINDDPNNPFAHFALAREYQKIQKYDSARDQYRHLIDQFPEYGGTYYHFALFLLNFAKIDESLSVIEKGMEILRKNKETHLLNELTALRDQYFEM